MYWPAQLAGDTTSLPRPLDANPMRLLTSLLDVQRDSKCRIERALENVTVACVCCDVEYDRRIRCGAGGNVRQPGTPELRAICFSARNRESNRRILQDEIGQEEDFRA